MKNASPLLTFRDLAGHGVPFKRRHLLELERAKKFPQRVRLGENSVRWVEAEVDAYVQAKIAARSN